MSEQLPEIVSKLQDLLKQATTERSHFYVGECCREAIQQVTLLAQENILLAEVLNRARIALLVSIKAPEELQPALGRLSLACAEHRNWQTERLSAANRKSA